MLNLCSEKQTDRKADRDSEEPVVVLFRIRTLCCLLLGFWGLFFVPNFVSAQPEEFQDGFESQDVSARVYFDPKRVQLKVHERNNSLAYVGQGAERLQFVSNDFNVPVTIEYEIKPSRILDETRISLAVSSNRPGPRLSARIVFPLQKDPETKLPLTRYFHGEALEKSNSWQQLDCRTRDDQVARQMILWRASLKPDELDSRGMYIDRVALHLTLARGVTEILVDDLKVSPVVAPLSEHLVSPQQEMVQESRPLERIEFQLDQLLVDGRPLFPVMIPYQREPIELFSQLGVNVVWVDNYLNRELVSGLNAQGLWATAWPPSSKSTQGEILDALQANPAPFGRETDGILFWNMGVRIEPESHRQLRHWVHQIKTSDREQKRPVMADVTGSELVFSRDVDMMGVSKHVLQSPYSIRDYSEHLKTRRQLAQPGTFVTTWIQTEPSRAVVQYRQTNNLTPAVIEPEQIRLQTYVALCAGYKGLGFWNWTPLNAEGAGYEERRLVLEQLCHELKLFEPFLASGEVIHRFEVPLKSTMQEGSALSRKPQERLTGKNSGADLADQQSEAIPPLAASAAVVRSEHGLMILLSALEANAQYVPGPMAQSDVQLMIRGLPESAFLWEITSTGLWPLETKRVAGGTEIRLPRFNTTAALMVATDQGVAQKMEEKIQATQQRSAELSLLLAEAKYARVIGVDQELISLGVGLPEATQILEQSQRTIDVAREAMQKQQYHQARVNADLSCQLMRVLQRLYWKQAVRNFSAPTSLTHTLCFQTLPDHWKLIQQLGRSDSQHEEFIRSGKFEDPDGMLVEGWTKDLSSSKQIIVYDALDPSSAREGEYCLRMAAVPAMGEEHVTLQSPAVSYRSPAVPVKPGDLLHVTGWVRIPRKLTGGLDGFRIYDSQYGAATCLRWSKPTNDWEQFELIRPIWKQEDLRLHFELNSLGDVAIDDLKVKIVQLNSAPVLQTNHATESNENQKSRGNALDFFNRFVK